jgi:hypothetical protein
MAINFYMPDNSFGGGQQASYKKDRIWSQSHIQNDTYLDKMICDYLGLSTFPLQDNFTVQTSNPELADWQIIKSGTNTVTYNTDVYNVQASSMEVRKTSTAAAVSARHYFNQAGNIVVQTSLRVTVTTSPYSVFVVTDSSNNYNVHTAFVSGYYAYYSGGSYHNVMAVSPGVWYQITLNINPSTAKYDIYIDGVLRTSQAPFRATGGTLCDIYCQAGWADTSSVSLFVDNLCVRAGDSQFIDQFASAPSSNGWTLYGVPASGTITQDPGNGYTANPSAKLAKTTTVAGYVAMSHTFTSQSSHLIVEAAMKVDSIVSPRYSVLALRSGSSIGVQFMMANGEFSWYEGSWPCPGAGMAYVANKYYLITLDITVSTHKYDIYIDGALVFKGANWCSSLSSLDNVYIQSQSSSETPPLTTWVDNVIVTT